MEKVLYVSHVRKLQKMPWILHRGLRLQEWVRLGSICDGKLVVLHKESQRKKKHYPPPNHHIIHL